MGMDRIPE